MKKLMIYMDNCITDGRILDYINDYLDTNYKLKEQDDFYLQNLVGEDKEDFMRFIKDKNIYEDAPLIKNCYEVLEKLNKKYELYIITAYLWNRYDDIDISGTNLMNKYYYLRKMLPFIHPKQYIFTSNKNLIKADIAIDDRLDNLENADKKILFTAWHNKNINVNELDKDTFRVNSWKEIEELIGGEDI